MPSYVLNPVIDHSTGEKRPCTEMSLLTTVRETGDAASGLHASLPVNPEDVDMVAGVPVNNWRVPASGHYYKVSTGNAERRQERRTQRRRKRRQGKPEVKWNDWHRRTPPAPWSNGWCRWRRQWFRTLGSRVPVGTLSSSTHQIQLCVSFSTSRRSWRR